MKLKWTKVNHDFLMQLLMFDCDIAKTIFFCRYFFLFHTLDLSIAANAFISNSIWRLFSPTNLLNWHNFLHSHFKRISNFDGTQCAHCTITEGHWIFGADFVCFFFLLHWDRKRRHSSTFKWWIYDNLDIELEKSREWPNVPKLVRTNGIFNPQNTVIGTLTVCTQLHSPNCFPAIWVRCHVICIFGAAQ